MEIELNQATAALRRIPFFAVDTDGVTPKTGLTFSGAEVKIVEYGIAPANGAGTVTEVSSGSFAGLYHYEATSGEVDVAGPFVLKFADAAMKVLVQSIVIRSPSFGGFISPGASAALRTIPFYALDPTDGVTPVIGLTISGSDVTISKNGATPGNGGGTASEVDSTNFPGLYYYEAASGDIDTAGYLAIRFSDAGMRTIVMAVQIKAAPSSGGSGYPRSRVVNGY